MINTCTLYNSPNKDKDEMELQIIKDNGLTDNDVPDKKEEASRRVNYVDDFEAKCKDYFTEFNIDW